MAGHDAVLSARGGHADDFLRPQIGGDEGQAANPCRNRTSSEEKIGASADIAFEHHTNPEHRNEVSQHDDPVDCGQLHENLAEQLPGWERVGENRIGAQERYNYRRLGSKHEMRERESKSRPMIACCFRWLSGERGQCGCLAMR